MTRRLGVGRRTALTLVAAAALITACGGDDDSTDEADAPAATDAPAAGDASGEDSSSDSTPTEAGSEADGTDETPADGGTLTVGIGSEPETLDPHKTRAGTDNYVLMNLYETLLSYNPDGELEGAIADEWEMSDDGLTYTFHIRDGVTFHNGQPLTADDVVFSLQRYADPATENVFGYNLAAMETVEATDPSTVVVTLSEPDGAFLSSRAYASIVSKAYFEEVGPDEFATNPVGTGPWMFDSRSIRESVTLKRFDGYWGAQPGYSELVFRIIGDDNSRVAAMRSGEVDVIAQVPPQSIATLEGTDGVKLATTVTGDNIFYMFNNVQEDVPWNDLRVRQALAMAIDQNAIYESVLGELGILISGVSPLNTGWDESAVAQPDYDPDGARKLLEDAGYGDGFSLDLVAPVNGRLPNSEQVTQAVAGFWQDIGIDVNTELVAYSQYVDMERSGSPLNGVVMGLWGDSLTFDPQARLVGTHTCDGPYAHTCDPELDALIETVRTTVDPDERVDAYKAAFDYINEQAYSIWMYTSEGAFAMKDSVDWQPYYGIPYTRMGNAQPAS